MRWLVVLLFTACATTKAVDTCTLAYEQCTNGCFKSPNYRHGGSTCIENPAGGHLCPQENQLLDTVEAGKCFDQCEWDHKLCSK